MKPNRTWLLAAVATLLVIGLAVTNRSSDSQPTDIAETGQAPATTTATATDTDTDADADTDTDTETGTRLSSLPTIGSGELPIEAWETLLLIDEGGPFPFDRDDLIFQNREGLLPPRSSGHYREYTVVTPGEDDRGARRIVAGADGERYYTADHYASFREITGS